MNRIRATRKRNQDLELRLGHSESNKGSALVTMQNIAASNFIVVDDDDEDVIHMSSSRIFQNEVQASSSRMFPQARTGVSRRSIRVPAISEADLELRLGIGGGGTPAQPGVVRISSDRNGGPERNRISTKLTITITDDVDEDIHKSSKRRKQEPISNKLSLNCPICMDSMKEESSTVCGHLFCRSCILSAIQVQKKCPTCRRKLTASSIHRIYLSSSSA